MGVLGGALVVLIIFGTGYWLQYQEALKAEREAKERRWEEL